MARPLSLKSPRLVQKKRRKIALVSSLTVVSLAALLYVISAVASLRALSIEDVSFPGEMSAESEPMAAYVKEALSGDYAWIFPKKNIFLYPKDAITAGLLERFPVLQSAELGLTDGRVLSVTAVERKPSSLWCEGDYARPVFSESDEGIPADCYFMDEAGLIYSKAPIFSGSAFMRYYGLVDAAEPLRLRYMEPAAFERLSLFVRGTREYGLPVAGLMATTSGEYEMYLDGPDFDEGETRISFDIAESLDDTFGNLTAFFDRQDFKRKGEAVARGLESLDLRFGNKIYYVWR